METLSRRMSRAMGSAAATTGRLRSPECTENIKDVSLNLDLKSPTLNRLPMITILNSRCLTSCSCLNKSMSMAIKYTYRINQEK
jgi:hypothetical protein